MRRITDWLATIQELGEAFFDVLKAELAAFKADLRSSVRLAVRAGQLFALAFLLLFWLIGILLAGLVVILGASIGYWQAAFVVALGLLILAAVLFARGRTLIGRVHGPRSTAEAHIQDHLSWVKSELMDGEPTGEDDESSRS